VQRLTHAFGVDREALWQALRASLHRVTTQATFWETERRVEWSSDATALAWGQVYRCSVDGDADGASVLAFSGKSPVRPSFGDRGRRAAIFQTLVDAVSKAVSQSADGADGPLPEDRLRYWNGDEWTIEPPTGAG
jgi:hypothetical protein